MICVGSTRLCVVASRLRVAASTGRLAARAALTMLHAARQCCTAHRRCRVLRWAFSRIADEDRRASSLRSWMEEYESSNTNSVFDAARCVINGVIRVES
jgi:hypothetical protein